MKPSNTGIDWEKHFPSNILNEWTVSQLDRAAQIAIAEYRKELAAKVARMDADTTDPEMMASEINYKDGWNDAIRTFRSLLNENDDAE